MAVWITATAMLMGRACLAAGPGESFGEGLMTLTSARQAGSGGVALEDPWREDSYIDISNVIHSSGLNWFGVNAQAGAGSALRIGMDISVFTASDIVETIERRDGSYGGEGNTVRVRELVAAVVGQRTILMSRVWRLAGEVSVLGFSQEVVQDRNVGGGIKIGMRAQRSLGSGQALTGWLLAGPLGRVAGRPLSHAMTMGAGYMAGRVRGFLGGPEGFAFGGEGQLLSEQLVHTGLGALYWFGDSRRKGWTLFLRGGVRRSEGSAQTVQPRAGMGLLWRSAPGWGLQFDYSMVPAGELGSLHYASLGVRWPAAP